MKVSQGLKKKNATKESLTKILSPYIPITDKNKKQAFRAVTEKYPEIITYRDFEQIIAVEQSPDKIATLILNKPRKKREESLSTKNYRGRKRSSDYDLLTKSDKILSQILQSESGGSQVGIFRNICEAYTSAIVEYSTPKEALVKFLSSTISLAKKFGQEAVDQQTQNLYLLLDTLDLFETELKKAKEKNDTLFLNTVRKVFKENATPYLQGAQGKRHQVNKSAIKNRWKLFWDYAKNKIKYTEVPRTFYQRAKPTAIIVLAKQIQCLFDEYYDKIIIQQKRELLILKLRKILSRCRISKDEVFPPIPAHLEQSLLGSMKQEESAKLDMKHIQELIAQLLNQDKMIEKAWESLKTL